MYAIDTDAAAAAIAAAAAATNAVNTAAIIAASTACRDSLMRNNYFALRCFMLDIWDHSLGECAVSPSTRLQKAVYQAADTNITSALGSRVITDVPHCVYLVDGGRICWVHSVRGEEFATPDTQVRA
jgi:hypothetical protein